MIPEVVDRLERAVASGHPPAACACAILDGRVVHESAHGEAGVDSVFDLASVTKVAATTLAVAALVGRGEVALDAPVARWLPDFAARGKAEVSVRALLGHRSGLAAWQPFFVAVLADPVARWIYEATPSGWERAREIVLARVFDAPLAHPPGRRVYSDLGFLALGALVEGVSGERLDAFVRREVHGSLDLGFVDLGDPAASFAAGRHVLATGRTRPREPAPGQEALYRVPPQPEREDAGSVDDDNAFAMGGVAGHAGLFGTARAVAQVGALVLDALDSRAPFGGVLRAMVVLDPAGGPARSLGFDRPAPEGSAAGALLGAGPRGAVGHLGFTGCSLWIDLDRRLSAALLTNRTLPGRAHVEPIRALRPAFHDALCRAIDGG